MRLDKYIGATRGNYRGQELYRITGDSSEPFTRTFINAMIKLQGGKKDNATTKDVPHVNWIVGFIFNNKRYNGILADYTDKEITAIGVINGVVKRVTFPRTDAQVYIPII